MINFFLTKYLGPSGRKGWGLNFIFEMVKPVTTSSRKFLLLGLLFLTFGALGQDFNFDIHNTSLDEYIKVEQDLGSERMPLTTTYVSLTGDAQPIKYLRKEAVIPDLITSYFFKKADSTMSYVLYEWDVRNFEQQDNNQKTEEFQNAVIARYKKLKKDITTYYGQPLVKRNYSNISRLDSINTFVESATWKPNDSTEIEMNATVSNFYLKKGIATINPVHRIRLYVRNRVKD